MSIILAAYSFICSNIFAYTCYFNYLYSYLLLKLIYNYNFTYIFTNAYTSNGVGEQHKYNS